MNIGEAALASGVSAKMIRYYESVALITPASRSEAGYRRYEESDVRVLRFIRHSRDLGFSIDRIRTLLALWSDRGRKSADDKALAKQYIAELDSDIRKLETIRDELRHLADCCGGNNRPDCPILDKLAE